MAADQPQAYEAPMIVALRWIGYMLLALGFVVLIASLLGSWFDGEPIYSMMNPFNIKLLVTAVISLGPGLALLWLHDWLSRRYANK
jgi:hypothetical protein